MKIFKYETDLVKIDIDDPALPIINEFIHRLIVTSNNLQHPYNPENDGYIVLLEEGDIDRPLSEIWKEDAYSLINAPWEGIAKDETGQFFIAVYLPNNQYGIVFVIPNEDWIYGELRECIEAHLDE